MATVRIKLDTRRERPDKTYPVVIRIYSGDKYRDVGLGFTVLKSQFNEGNTNAKIKASHPEAKSMNLAISQKLHEVKEGALKLQMKEEIVTADRIKDAVVKPVAKYSFLQYGWRVVEQLKQLNKHGNADIYRDALNGLVIHSKKQSIEFKELTYEFLQQVENNMIKAGLMVNSISVYFRTIRAIYNKAIKEKVVDKALYPFDDYKIKTEQTIKRSITRQEVAQIANMNLDPTTPEHHARNYFMLSFNMIGISFADMATIRPEDITSGRLIFKRKKTHRIYNIKLTDKAIELLALYQQEGRTYILPVIPEHAVDNPREERKYIQYANKTCNKYLDRIGKELKIQQKITSYFSRHSWASVCKKMGYSKDLISEALGHTSGNRVTEIYLSSYDQDVIDAMNEAVCKL